MVAVHLALGLEKPAPPEGQGIAKGRALLVADDGADVTPEDLVKLLFFMGDLLMDTLGKVSGDEFETKMENMKLLWAFYGPGVHVQKCEALTRKVGPGPNDVKVFPLAELKKVRIHHSTPSPAQPHPRVNPGPSKAQAPPNSCGLATMPQHAARLSHATPPPPRLAAPGPATAGGAELF